MASVRRRVGACLTMQIRKTDALRLFNTILRSSRPYAADSTIRPNEKYNKTALGPDQRGIRVNRPSRPALSVASQEGCWCGRARRVAPPATAKSTPCIARGRAYASVIFARRRCASAKSLQISFPRETIAFLLSSVRSDVHRFSRIENRLPSSVSPINFDDVARV